MDGGTHAPDIALITDLGLYVHVDIADDEGITRSEIGVGIWIFALLMDEDEGDLTV